MKPAFFSLLLLLSVPSILWTQNGERPSLQIGTLNSVARIDGLLNESDWATAPYSENFLTTVPVEGGQPSGITRVRVLANDRQIIIGVDCWDDAPQGIVRFSKLRDAELKNEDHVRLVLDPFIDGQSGYIFSVNANGARYDALVSNRGESENKDWDAVWEAATTVHEKGWSVEIRIPIQSISFKKGLTQWGFNIERRIQRNQETIRWANVKRDQWFTQTSRAGLLTGLPKFNYGIGLNLRPSVVAGLTKEAGSEKVFDFEPSLDASQRIGPNMVASLTVNTDFAETEVDTRQTNLTRFPLFFPEKRTFFLEGADIFDFGLGLRRTLIPFFSRRIGLFENEEVPVAVGGKLNGRIGKTAFSGLAMHTRKLDTEASQLSASTMGVVRARQNILGESSVGVLGTFGDPQGRDGSWMSGADFTYQTTRFRGDKNFLIGAWGVFADRKDLTGDRSAFGAKIDYPNDRWDVALTYIRIGDDFDPSLGFAPRQGIHSMRLGLTFAPRPEWKWLRQMFNELFASYVLGTDGQWQSYGVFTSPINWRLESGERVEANIYPQGENLSEPFEIAENVVIPTGSYHFTRYRLEMETAAKRRLNGELTWWFGPFYEGHLHIIESSVNWTPTNFLAFEGSLVRNIGRLPFGNFEQTLTGLRVRFNATPDLQLNAFMQYDNESKEMGLNARLHWIFNPLGDLFLVYNDNNFRQEGRWLPVNRQLILKVRYNFRV